MAGQGKLNGKWIVIRDEVIIWDDGASFDVLFGTTKIHNGIGQKNMVNLASYSHELIGPPGVQGLRPWYWQAH